MKCPKCGSDNVNVQVVTEAKTELLVQKKHHGILWWICIGWWWLPVKWLFLTVPAFLVKFLAPKTYKTKTHIAHKSMCVCQSCGHHWKA